MRSLFNYSGLGGAGSGMEIEANTEASVLWLSPSRWSATAPSS